MASRVCLVYSSTLKLEATRSSEMSVDFQRISRRYILEDRTLEDRYFPNACFVIFIELIASDIYF
jgi:hypothetical protein